MKLVTRSFPMGKRFLIGLTVVMILVTSGTLALILTGKAKPGQGQREAKWALIAFFGLGLACALVALPIVISRRPPAVTIDDVGVTAPSKGRMERVAWDDVERASLSANITNNRLINAAADMWGFQLHRRSGGAPVRISGAAYPDHEELKRALLEACAAKGIAVERASG